MKSLDKALFSVEHHAAENDKKFIDVAMTADAGVRWASLGRFTDGKFCLKVLMQDPNASAFLVEPGGNIIPRQNLFTDADPTIGFKAFQLNVGIAKTIKGQIAYAAPMNKLHVLSFGDDSTFDISEVSIFSRAGQFFLSVQDVYTGIQLFEGEGGAVACPYFQDNGGSSSWQQLLDYIKNVVPLEIVLIKWPSAKDYVRKAPKSTKSLRVGMAIVEFFNVANGMGSLRLHNGETARFHWSQLVVQKQSLAIVLEGDLVSYKKLKSPEDIRTSFTYEATGVAKLGLLSSRSPLRSS